MGVTLTPTHSHPHYTVTSATWPHCANLIAHDIYIRYASTPQLGPGAGIHISNQAEPVGAWLKAGGTVEGAGIAKAFSPTVVAAVRSKSVTGR